MAKRPDNKRELSEADAQELRRLITERAKNMSEDDLRKLLNKEQEMEGKLKKLGSALPKLRSNLKVSFSMVKDYWKGDYRKIPFWSVATAAAALGYFIAPTDMLPDMLPIVGYLDDATVLAAVMAGVREDMKAYCEARGISLDG